MVLGFRAYRHVELPHLQMPMSTQASTLTGLRGMQGANL